MRNISSIIILFLVSCASIAGDLRSFSDQGRPISWTGCRAGIDAHLCPFSVQMMIIHEHEEQKVIADGYLSLGGVVIGITTLDEVADIFGKSEIYTTREQSSNFVCYVSENDDTGVVFESGPLGAWIDVTAFVVIKTEFLDVARCKKSKLVDRQKMVVNGLSLGLSVDDVQKKLGKPTYRDTSYLAYRYADKTLLKDEVFDVTSGIRFGFRGNEITWFDISKVLSN